MATQIVAVKLELSKGVRAAVMASSEWVMENMNKRNNSYKGIDHHPPT